MLIFLLFFSNSFTEKNYWIITWILTKAVIKARGCPCPLRERREQSQRLGYSISDGHRCTYIKSIKKTPGNIMARSRRSATELAYTEKNSDGKKTPHSLSLFGESAGDAKETANRIRQEKCVFYTKAVIAHHRPLFESTFIS